MFLSTLCFNSAYLNTLNDADNLMSYLFNTSTYHVEVRPIMDQSKPLTISTDVYLVSLGDVDEVAGKISLVLVFSLFWNNEKLVWNPALFGGLDSLVLPKTKLWVPELFLVNPADDIQPIGNKHMKVALYSYGGVWWTTGGSVTSACSMDMSKFPFDEQTCDIRIMNWGYPANKVNFRLNKIEADRSRYTDNGEWTLVSAVSELVEFSHIPELKFKITIKRKPLYFVLSVIMPIAALSAMNPIVFQLPVDTGERVSFSITVSLSFAVFLSLTSDIIPQSSEPMSSLIYFLFGAQLLSGIIATMNAVIIKIYAQSSDKKIPKVFVFLATAINITNCSSQKHSAKVENFDKNDLNAKFQDEKANNLDNLKLSNMDYVNDNMETDEKQQVCPIQSPTDDVTWTQVGKTLDFVAYILSNVVCLTGCMAFIVLIVT